MRARAEQSIGAATRRGGFAKAGLGDLGQALDQRGKRRGDVVKARAAHKPALVHIERAVDLDLQRMPVALRLAVMLGREPAGIRGVDRNPEAALGEEAAGGFADWRGAGRTVAITKDDVGRAAATNRADRRRHRVAIEQQIAAVQGFGFRGQPAERQMIGMIEFVNAPLRLGKAQFAGIDFLAAGDDAGDRPEPDAHTRGGRVDKIRQRVGKHRRVEFIGFAVDVEIGARKPRRQQRRAEPARRLAAAACRCSARFRRPSPDLSALRKTCHHWDALQFPIRERYDRHRFGRGSCADPPAAGPDERSVMQRRKLGQLEVAAIGLGCATMTPFYGEPDAAAAIATLERAADLGVDLLDTADAYGQGRNEELLARVLRDRRAKFVVATKFGNMGRNPDGSAAGEGRPDYVRQACERSLKRLGTDYIDLYYIHRVDPKVPIEETIGAMGDLVRAGKVRHIGICEAGPATIRRAHAVHRLSAVQTEYSLWSRDVETEILPLCRELGIGFVAYSPLGRGFLTGNVRTPGDLAANDSRRNMPRFAAENLPRNFELVAQLRQLAHVEGCTPAQLALAWLLSRGDDVVPIPGTSHSQRLEENAAAAELAPSAPSLARLDEIFRPGAAAGPRYPEAYARTLGI